MGNYDSCGRCHYYVEKNVSIGECTMQHEVYPNASFVHVTTQPDGCCEMFRTIKKPENTGSE